jgi:DUF4097 and DUF4098 domain-containing protein YvlB
LPESFCSFSPLLHVRDTPDREERVSDGQNRRRSIFPGLLLIVLGAIFLLHRFDPAFGIGHLARVYWPFLIILWGVAKLIDHFAAQRTGQSRPPLLSGGEAALLVLLAFVLIAFGLRDWVRDRFPGVRIDLEPFHRPYSQSRELAAQAIPAGSHVIIESGRGNISVHGSEGNELRVSVNESASGANESDADSRMKNVGVVIEQTGGGYSVHPVHQSDFHETVNVDLDVQLPKTASVTLHTPHGDINVSGIAGVVDARTENGDIEIHDAGSDVAAQLQKGDARITGVAGNVGLKGRGSDVEVADVAGNATLDGPFVGSTIVRKVGKMTRVTSPWADLTIVQLTGRLEMDSGDIQMSDAAGFAKIQTHNKDISIENVAGQLDVVNSHGDVKIVYANSLREALNVTNDTGGVELRLPARSSFQISAFSRSGQVESEFEDPSLKTTDESEDGRLNGQFGGKSGSPGPKITITTSYGTIALHKSS